ncbi:pyrroline-5-carboxylate reductase [Fusobacterium sp. MFO224]|uniref:pyrroline-5-carboxylate reductase n=1 Tax=Fusobacterium sp. MFO224 TaxID=3378070 RepID=UPI0038556368
MNKKIGFIGTGNMGQAMLKGIISSKIVPCENILVSDKDEVKLKEISAKFNIVGKTSNKFVAENSDILILSIKPNIYNIVIEEIKDIIKEETIVITLAPNLSLENISKMFSRELKIVRSMPNTPAFVGAGMSAVVPNLNITKDDLNYVLEIFNSFGKVEIVDEKIMSTVVAVSGSSPAYIFMLIEAMADAAVSGGMTRTAAYKFAAQSVLGSAKMVLETGLHPGILKDMVCSPGGTTIDAVMELEKSGFRNSIIQGMKACENKAKNM